MCTAPGSAPSSYSSGSRTSSTSGAIVDARGGVVGVDLDDLGLGGREEITERCHDNKATDAIPEALGRVSSRLRPKPAQPSPDPVRNLTAMDERFTTHDWALFVSVSGIWGASFLFIDIGLDAMPPGLDHAAAGRRSVRAALALVPRQRVAYGRSDLRRIVLLSVVWVAIPFTLFPIAEQHIRVRVAGLLNGGTPIFAAIVRRA